MIFEKQIVNAYKGMMYTRCDDTETVFYFSHRDFPGLSAQPYSFSSSLGHTLSGYVYSYDGASADRLVVFDHGFGGGHLAYMKEIERLCRHGYVVLAYDHTGCMESEGDTPGGLAQSLSDLNDCISAVKSDEQFAGVDISVMGHSWGAFSTLNITALHPDITHIVAMCGFVSVDEMISTIFGGPLKMYRKAVLSLERESNLEFSKFDAKKTLSASDTKALLIYSSDDKLCRRNHYDILKCALKEKENVRFILEDGKGHNPNYTKDAVKYLADFVKKRGKLLKKKSLTKEEKESFVASFDWDRMTEQDDTVWSKILEHLDN